MSTMAGHDAAGESMPGGEPPGELIRIDVFSVKAYDSDPRQGENPEYQRIKASIRAEGMDQPLVVTQRPGDRDYMMYAGGNTRLRILQELHEETGEERFREVTCIYRPWTQETDVLLAHLRENDLRGDLTFLDKASAVMDAKRLIQEEQGEGSITQTHLAEALRDRGYPLSQGLISQMEYTVERLLPLLPAALRSGMGRPQVERIRQLERAVRALWRDRSVDTEDEFDQAFTALCRRYDSPEWDIANLRRALEAEIAERVDVSIHAASMVLEGYLAGRRDSEVGSQWLSEKPDANHATARSDTESAADTEASQSPTNPESSGIAGDVRSRRVDPQGRTNSEDAPVPSCPERDKEICSDDTDTPQANERARTSNAQHGPTDLNSLRGPMDLKSLRARAWTLASRLAQRNGLSELVQPLSGKGLGFLLRDVPDPALVDQLDEDTLAQVSMVWWYLAAAAEVTVAPVEHLLPGFAEESVLQRALEDQDAGLLFSSVWTLDPGHMGFRLWRRLDQRDWRDLVDLMENYRALHRAAEALGDNLWR